MFNLVYYQTNLFIFDTLLLYYYINLKSSLILCLSSGDIYLSLCVSLLSSSLVTVPELFCYKVLRLL